MVCVCVCVCVFFFGGGEVPVRNTSLLGKQHATLICGKMSGYRAADDTATYDEHVDMNRRVLYNR